MGSHDNMSIEVATVPVLFLQETVSRQTSWLVVWLLKSSCPFLLSVSLAIDSGAQTQIHLWRLSSPMIHCGFL